jgi:translation initiation factor IF-2
VLGLNNVPDSGDIFGVVSDESEAHSILKKQEAAVPHVSLSITALSRQIGKGDIKELNAVLKTDVYGSIEPIKSSLEQLSSEKVKINVIHADSGSVTESDVLLASASKGVVIGFNSPLSPGAQQLAEVEGVSIRLYDVIYKLIEDMDKVLKGMLEPTYVDVVVGRVEVRAVFSSSRQGKIAGAYVKEGRIWRDAPAKIFRQNKIICESRISSLRRFKDDVTEVTVGIECGVGIADFPDCSVGDIIELYQKEKVE